MTEICTSATAELSWKLVRKGTHATHGDYYYMEKEVTGCKIKYNKSCVTPNSNANKNHYKFYITNDSSVTGSSSPTKWCIKSKFSGKFWREDRDWSTIKTANNCNKGNKRWYLYKDND